MGNVGIKGAALAAALGPIFSVLILLFSGIFTADALVLADFAAARSSAYFWGYVFAGVNILMVSFWQ